MKRPAPPGPFVLGIETSTPWGGVALAGEGVGLVAHRWFHARTGYGRRLLASIDATLRDAGAGRESVVAVAATRGPGSFTGVRLGLTVAKTLARATGARLHLFSTLEAFAARAPGEGPLCPMLDARRGEVYTAIFERESDFAPPTRLRGDAVEPCARLLESRELAEAVERFGRMRFAGDGADLRREEIERALGSRAEFVPPPWNRPGADSVALLGLAAGAAGDPGIDPLAAAPSYLRASDAERKLDAIG